MYFTSPTKAEVERYFEENDCIYCSGEAYGEVYRMRRQTAMLFGQIFKIPEWRLFPNVLLYMTTPFNYYQDMELVPMDDDWDKTFHRYTWVDTREGRFVYDAVKGEYVKDIDDKEHPAIKYGREMSGWAKQKVTSTQAKSKGDYTCSYNAYNCADFNTQAEAQAVMLYCGNDDIHYLDGDDDGIACEALP